MLRLFKYLEGPNYQRHKGLSIYLAFYVAYMLYLGVTREFPLYISEYNLRLVIKVCGMVMDNGSLNHPFSAGFIR